MLSLRTDIERPDALSGPHDWKIRIFHESSEVTDLAEEVTRELAEVGYGRKDVFAVRLALEEALVNAVKHGNQGDPRKQVCLRYLVSAAELSVEIEDQGEGFCLEDIPDPLDPENVERACGRGLLLIRTYMTSVCYSGRGNLVRMTKVRS